MNAIMVVYMDVRDAGWIKDYFASVPTILTEYGGTSLAGSRDIRRIEGNMETPDRMAVLGFPSLDHITRFMADPQYARFRDARQAGATSQIFVFENAVTAKELV